MIEDDFEEELEDDGEGIELCIGPDGVLRKKESKPTVSLQFNSEEEMLNWLSTVGKMSLIDQGILLEVENIEDPEQFLDKLNSKLEGAD